MSSTHSALIQLSRRVTFADGSNFRKQLFARLDSDIKHLAIDLSETEFMDSSGLGMLLVALKECELRSVSMVLVQPKGDVKKLLELTRSNERFSITY